MVLTRVHKVRCTCKQKYNAHSMIRSIYHESLLSFMVGLSIVNALLYNEVCLLKEICVTDVFSNAELMQYAYLMSSRS